MVNEPRTAAEVRRLDVETLEIDAKQALARERPATDAIWAALLKPRRVVLRRFAQALALVEERDQDVADMLRDADGRQLVGPLGRLVQADPDVSALIGVGEALVAKALMGDSAAINMLMERIEGKAGARRNDVDPDELGHREEILTAIEETVKAMQRRPGDDARDVTPARPNGHAVIDIEAEIRDMTPKGKKNGNGHAE